MKTLSPLLDEESSYPRVYANKGESSLGSKELIVSDEYKAWMSSEARAGRSKISEFSDNKKDSPWVDPEELATIGLTQLNSSIFIEMGDREGRDWNSLTNL